jgi:parallel beta-helix repeat protein
MPAGRPTRRAVGAVLAVLGVLAALAGCTSSAAPSTPAASSGSTAPTVSSAATVSSAPTVSAAPTVSTGPLPAVPGEIVVRDAPSLRAALAAARPGQTITLADGTYSGDAADGSDGKEPGRYVIDRSGTAADPITLRGGAAATLTGGGPGGGYVLHLVGAQHWRLVGFTVADGAKGIVLDGSGDNLLDGLHVRDVGDEGVHFRANSSRNTLRNSTIQATGLRSEGFGEGVYIGSANSNWERYTGGLPDRSDDNSVLGNRIFDTRAENIDIKEGTQRGIIRGNVLGGDAIAGQNSADSWIDVKGSYYVIEGNEGTHSAGGTSAAECSDGNGRFCNGIEVHTPIEGSGAYNIIRANTLAVNAPGVGVWLQNDAVERGNVIGCDNRVTGAGAGDFATNHYQALPCTA